MRCGQTEPALEWRKRLATLTVACLVLACNSDKPALTGANEDLGGDCQPFLDLLVDYTLANGEDGTEAGMAALGAPDENSVEIAPNAVLLGGFVTTGGIISEDGADLLVHGTGSEDAEVAVYVGRTPTELSYSGALTQDTVEIDFATAAATHVIYLRLIGLSGSFRVDAIEAIQTTCSE